MSSFQYHCAVSRDEPRVYYQSVIPLLIPLSYLFIILVSRSEVYKVHSSCLLLFFIKNMISGSLFFSSFSAAMTVTVGVVILVRGWSC